MKNKDLVKRSFRQYIVVLNFVSKLNRKIKLLDVGSQDSKLKEILPYNIEYKSLDIEGKADYKCDLNKKKIPLKDKTFDVTICLETLEHVLYPSKVIDELIRITKDDGFIIISMPNEYNFWLRLNHLFGIKREESDANLEVVAKLGHIHKPRVCDILKLSSKKLSIIKIIPLWQSTSSVRDNKINSFFYLLDRVINIFAKVYPSLFSRLVVVIARKKNEHINN